MASKKGNKRRAVVDTDSDEEVINVRDYLDMGDDAPIQRSLKKKAPEFQAQKRQRVSE